MRATQVTIIEQYCKGQIDEQTLREHVPGIVADMWVNLKEELSPADLESSFQTFLSLEQAARLSVETQEDDDGLFR